MDNDSKDEKAAALKQYLRRALWVCVGLALLIALTVGLWIILPAPLPNPPPSRLLTLADCSAAGDSSKRGLAHVDAVRANLVAWMLYDENDWRGDIEHNKTSIYVLTIVAMLLGLAAACLSFARDDERDKDKLVGRFFKLGTFLVPLLATTVTGSIDIFKLRDQITTRSNQVKSLSEYYHVLETDGCSVDDVDNVRSKLDDLERERDLPEYQPSSQRQHPPPDGTAASANHGTGQAGPPASNPSGGSPPGAMPKPPQ